ncbi:hypothetical protein [Desulfovermiculus halophilus]|jgi:hypothetical protein|uniref:hypothetical protein n=1 Tax=Desulfovermiculus halophilus TaxID=339722 RepID=UPI00048055C4|nr:hypothetical protein [Desulfovermiculus halophilus]
MPPRIFQAVREMLKGIDAAHREQAASLTEVECRELENIFALLVVGSFVGLPAPPSFLAVELLPYMDRELELLQCRARDSGDMLAELCGTLGID